MRPAAAELFRQNAARKANSSSARCLPQGLPRTDINSYAPFKIIQTPGVIAVLYEVDNTHRQIYTDGRPLPVDPQPTWGGYSVGRWDGDTLIVDAAGFNEGTWLDSGGHPHSDALRIQERFHRRDFGHMDVSVTVDDPQDVHEAVYYQRHRAAAAGHRHSGVGLQRERERPGALG